MVATSFKPLVEPSRTAHENRQDFTSYAIKNAFRVETIAVMGAVTQILLFAVLPYRVALLPASVLLANAFFKTLIQTSAGDKNPFMNDVIPHKFSAQLPSSETGKFGYRAADEPVVVFHFGVRFNHPLGIFAPGGKEIAAHFDACMKSITDRSEEYGLLGQTSWVAGERASNNTIMWVFFFRDVEGIHKFAHDEIHKVAWKWLSNCGHKHLGFFHESFSVPRQAYETIYVNCPPLLMGATSIKTPDEEGNEQYQRPIVDAETGVLKSQFGRLGRTTQA